MAGSEGKGAELVARVLLDLVELGRPSSAELVAELRELVRPVDVEDQADEDQPAGDAGATASSTSASSSSSPTTTTTGGSRKASSSRTRKGAK